MKSHLPKTAHRLRRLVALVMTLIGVVALSAACSSGGGSGASDSPGGDRPLKIAFANINNSSTFFNVQTTSMKDAAEVTGYDVSYFDNKSDAQTTLSNAQLMVQQKPDLIIEYYGDESVVAATDAVFERAGIPCITLNVRGTGYCSWFNVSNPDICAQTGQALGTIAADRGWSGDDSTVVLIAANSFGPTVNTCQGFAYEQMQDTMPGLARIDSYKDITMTTTTVGDTTIQIDGAGLLDNAYKAMSDALSSIPTSRNVVVYAIGDDMAVGAMRAIEQANRTDTTILGGWGNTTEALNELRTNPAWVAEGDPFYGFWGEFTQAMAPLVLDGADIPLLTTSPVAVLTKDLTIDGTVITAVDSVYKDGEDTASMLPPLTPVESRLIADIGETGTIGNEYLAASGILQKFGNVTGLE